MSISIELISEQDKSILVNLFQLYMHDLTRFLYFGLNQHGLFDYKYLDLYWIYDNYVPHFIKKDGQIAGFILVNNHFLVLEKTPDSYSVSEFFVLNSFKRQGVGKKAANLIFDKYRGSWEVAPVAKSEEAEVFWGSVIKEYTNNKFSKEYPKPNRPVYLFKN